MAPRILPVAMPDVEQADLLAKTQLSPDAPVLNVFATLAHHPRLLRRVNALGGALMAHGSLAARDRELVILRVAARTRSRYEFAQHAVIGVGAGLADDEVSRIAEMATTSWAPPDRQLLDAVDELLEDDTLGDSSWHVLASRYGEAELLELLVLVGFYRMIAGYLRSVRIEPEDGVAIPLAAAGSGWI